MIQHTLKLFERYRTKGVLLDSNILLLYFIGLFRPELVSRFKRTRNLGFVEEDFYTLDRFVSRVRKVVTTPNILTEVSNLAGQLPNHLKGRYFEIFAAGITELDEEYLSSSEVSGGQEFTRFGLTDAGIIRLVNNQYLVLTDDFKLSGLLAKKGYDVINFNHIRPINWQ